MNIRNQVVAVYSDGRVKVKSFFTDYFLRSWVRKQFEADCHVQINIVNTKKGEEKE